MIKYSSVILFAALIFCLQSFGQIANRVETDTSRLLINKWVITALEMQGTKVNLPAEDTSKDFFEFKSDGTGINSESGRLHSVLWNYGEEAGRLNIDGLIYFISKINKFQLIIFGMDGKDKITIYFKAIN